jgi:hypothetical protein
MLASEIKFVADAHPANPSIPGRLDIPLFSPFGWPGSDLDTLTPQVTRQVG